MCDALSMDPDHPIAGRRAADRAPVSSRLRRRRGAAWAGGDEEGAAVLRASGTRSAMVVPMAAGDRAIGVVTLGTRRARGGSARMSWRSPASLGAAPPSRWRTRACTRALAHRHHAPAPPAAPAPAAGAGRHRRRALSRRRRDQRVGGDFYDSSGSATPMVVVGDVTGKGPAAAAITSLARYTMRTAAMYERSPGAVLRA